VLLIAYLGGIMADPLSMRHAWYEGDHPARHRPLTGKLRVRADGISVRSWHGSVAFAWDSITGVHVTPAAADQQVYSRTRIALLGLWAYLTPKIKASEMRISTVDGDAFVIVDHIESEKLRVRLAPWIARLDRNAR
jgi:hypothetical protein